MIKLLTCILVLSASSCLHAGLIGPSPYLSFTDSPFSGVNFTNFYLEDFESGLLTTPGVMASAGSVLGPGSLTDSVDGDDGIIDGSGTLGHSFFISGTKSLVFTFDSSVFGGRLPTHAGIVWTDVGFTGGPLGIDGVSFTALDENGNSLGSIGPFTLGDGQADGGTAEDRFFGAVNPGGISQIRISMASSEDWEVDHLQYGFVPEPSTWICVAGGLSLILFGQRKR